MAFSNHTGRTLPSTADFDKIFNAVGGDPVLAPTGSVRDYYSENSYGTMLLNSTVFAWVTLPNTEAYYAGGSSGIGVGGKAQEAVQAALALADPLINFSQFDQDSDGFVDAITFMHSGYGAEWGGTDSSGANYTDRIWSHKWAIPAWTSAEGVRVSPYDINPALWGTSGTNPGRIGVVCHETGHFFGLPDLYDYDSGAAASEGVGNWCLMGGGSWGFAGDQLHPSHMSAWCKSQLGWMSPTVASSGGSYTLGQAESNPSAYRINQNYPSGEYLLVENREPAGFETAMPHGGLLVWHIDEAQPDNDLQGYPGQAGWPQNNQHYRVALLQADGNYDLERDVNRGDSGDPYYSGGTTFLGPATVPNTNAYQGGTIIVTNNALSNIGPSGPSMTFDLALGSASIVCDTTSVSVPEGGTAQFQVKLSAQPPSDVSVSVARSSGDGNISVQSGASLTFTTSNWSGYQAVTLAAAEDADTTNGQATITCGASGLSSVNVTATEMDNDGWQTLFSEGFEGVFPGANTTRYGNPTWGATTYTAHTGSLSGYCVGSSVAAPGPYPNGVNSWMLFGPLDFSQALDAKMDFWYRNKSESGYDNFWWLASVDNSQFYGYFVSGDQNTWRFQTFDLKTVPTLGNLCGRNQVWIAFYFGSDSSFADIGAFVDDIVIQKKINVQADAKHWMMYR